MRQRARRTVLTFLAVAVACMGVSAAGNQPGRLPTKKTESAKPKSTKGAPIRKRAARGMRAKGSSRTSAAHEAARLGAAVGHECNGKAAMQRDEHRWVVLCSSGKTYLVEIPSPQSAGTPPLECSLAGNGPFPGCFQ